jgi:hypothetical protein
MANLLSPVARLYIILLLSGVYWWYIFGYQSNNPIFTDTNLGLIYFRTTVGLPFILFASLYNFRTGLKILMKPSIITVSILFLLFFMGSDLLLRYFGVADREAPLIHTLYLGLRIAIIIWIFGIRDFTVSHNQLLLVLSVYLIISVILDMAGQIDAFQTVDFYAGYIDWLTSRYSGLSFNTNMFAGILLTVVAIHTLLNCRNDWQTLSGFTVSILLIILAISTKGRFGLIICATIGLIWMNIWLKGMVSKIIGWSGVILTMAFIILSVRFSIFPLSDQMPYINTQPSFYRLAHEPNFRSVLSSQGIGLSDFEQRTNYQKFVDKELLKNSYSQVNSENQKLQQSKKYTAAHSIFLSLPLDYGAGSLFVFLIINVILIYRFMKVFGVAIETQLLFLTFGRYFHQQMSIASWSLVLFQLAFLFYSEKKRNDI